MFKFIQSIFDAETMGEEIVKTNVKTYFVAKEMHPNGSRLEWLIATYCGRMRALRQQFTQFDAEYACAKFVDIPEPDNARALGLSLLHMERNDIVSNYPKFSNELNGILAKHNQKEATKTADPTEDSIKKKPRSYPAEVIIVCDNCGIKNKIPKEKLEKKHIFKPVCAVCKAELKLDS